MTIGQITIDDLLNLDCPNDNWSNDNQPNDDLLN